METTSEITPDPDVVFFYFSGSRDAPTPGYGAGEMISKGREMEFEELAKIKGWRKQLSNFWIAPFRLDNLTWNTVEHYYQGAKFKNNNPEFYRSFSIESGSAISKDPLLAKAAGGKSGKCKGILLREAKVVIDDDYFNGRSHLEMERALHAKFSQHPELAKLLLLTNNATLTHGTRGVPTAPMYGLMKVRAMLK